MQCPNCQANIPDDDVFCEVCGQRLSNASCPHRAGEDGFCELCGLRVVPPPEDHEEIVLSPDFAGVTDRGVRRTRNEDRFALRQAGGADILVVCDGVSTSHDSQLASAAAAAAAADSLAQTLDGAPDSDHEKILQSALAAAARSVAGLGPDGPEGNPEDNPPSTTIVAAIVQNGSAAVGWAGDSRAYWVSHGAAKQLTIDHSWLSEVVAKGEMPLAEAEKSPTAHAITRWLGADAPAADSYSVVCTPLGEPGVLLLCTDGLWNYVSDGEHMAALVLQLQNGTGDMLKLTRGLIEFAKKKGGSDNITAAALRVHKPEPATEAPEPDTQPATQAEEEETVHPVESPDAQ